ncbi:MAG: succinate dehydrogenase [Pseudomonadota bacterium]
MIRPHRRHPLWLAFLLHRISGIGLALFLPAHFYVLSLAVNEAAMDAALTWTANPLVKLAEGVLVFLLAVHLFGGLRLLALEGLGWSHAQKTVAAGAVAASAFVSGLFLFQAV